MKLAQDPEISVGLFALNGKIRIQLKIQIKAKSKGMWPSALHLIQVDKQNRLQYRTLPSVHCKHHRWL